MVLSRRLLFRSVIWEIARPRHPLTAGHILIRHKIKQTDLAVMAGIARENVNRALSDWERRRVVISVPQPLTGNREPPRQTDAIVIPDRDEISACDGKRRREPVSAGRTVSCHVDNLHAWRVAA